VDFPVENQDNSPVGAPHRLGAASYINDRKAPVTEPYLVEIIRAVANPIPRSIGPAVRQQIRSGNKSLVVLSSRSGQHPSENPTHQGTLFCSTLKQVCVIVTKSNVRLVLNV